MEPNWRSQVVCQQPPSLTALTTLVLKPYSSFPSPPPVVAWTASPAAQSATNSFVQWERVSPTSERRLCPLCLSDNAKLSADAKATTCISKTTQESSSTKRVKWRDQPSPAPSPRSALSSGPESLPTLVPSSEASSAKDDKSRALTGAQESVGENQTKSWQEMLYLLLQLDLYQSFLHNLYAN